MTDQQTAPNVATEPAAAAPKSEAPAAPPPPVARSRRKLIPLILVILGVVRVLRLARLFRQPEGAGQHRDRERTHRRRRFRSRAQDRGPHPRSQSARRRSASRPATRSRFSTMRRSAAREDQARAALPGAEARAKSARDQIAVYEQQLQQNDLRRSSRRSMQQAACVRRRPIWPPRNPTSRSSRHR